MRSTLADEVTRQESDDATQLVADLRRSPHREGIGEISVTPVAGAATDDGDQSGSLAVHLPFGYARCHLLYENGRLSDLVYLETNATFEAIIGVFGLPGSRASEVVLGLKEERRRMLELISRVVTSGQQESAELHPRHLGKWLSVIVHRINEHEIALLVRDLTERRQAQAALAHSEHILRQTVDFAPLPTLLTEGPEGRVLLINRIFTQTFGYSAKDLRSRADWWVRAYPDEGYRRQICAEWDAAVARARREKRASINTGVATVTCRDGSTRDAEFHLSMIDDLSIVTLLDVTERNRVRRELEASESRYRSLVENLKDVIFSLDPAGRIVYISPRIETLSGRPAADFLGRPFDDFLHPDDRHAAREAFARSTTITEPRVLHFLDASGATIHGLVSLHPLVHNDRLVEIRGTLTDMTRTVRAEHTAREAQARQQRTLHRLQATIDAAVGALATTVEVRDPYTAGHQRRVTELVDAIGRRLRLGKRRLDALRLASLMHDLGKISIPSDILSKPGALTAAERLMLNEHPETGYRILREIKFPGPVAKIVLEHHERLDGSGYPQGLSGEALRIESRVLGVADVVEAMSSHRPYRPALGIPAALEFISRNKGTLFDPEVVEACTQLFEQGFSFPE